MGLSDRLIIPTDEAAQLGSVHKGDVSEPMSSLLIGLMFNLDGHLISAEVALCLANKLQPNVQNQSFLIS